MNNPKLLNSRSNLKAKQGHGEDSVLKCVLFRLVKKQLYNKLFNCLALHLHV
jgi:hypothetical protein